MKLLITWTTYQVYHPETKHTAQKRKRELQINNESWISKCTNRHKHDKALFTFGETDDLVRYKITIQIFL